MNSFPLDPPETPEDLERNLLVMEQDLGLSRAQIVADAEAFARRTSALPEIYTAEEKGYLYTILAMITGFKSERQLFAERLSVIADNLEYYRETGDLSDRQLSDLVHGMARAAANGTSWVNPYVGAPPGETLSMLHQAIVIAHDFGPSAQLVTFPIVTTLLGDSKSTIKELVQVLYDAIAVGLEEDDRYDSAPEDEEP